MKESVNRLLFLILCTYSHLITTPLLVYFIGLECLLDFVDNLDLDGGPVFDDDTDDWSEPASSILGNTPEADESLLFEI
jgi:hypothetical protein